MDKDTSKASVFALLSADTPPVSKEPISRYALRSGGSQKSLSFIDKSESRLSTPRGFLNIDTPKLLSGIKRLDETLQTQSSVLLSSSNNTSLFTSRKLRSGNSHQVDIPDQSSIMPDLSVTNDAALEETMDTALLLDEETILQATDSIYEDYLNLYKSYSGEHQLFELLKGYENACAEKVNLLQKIYIKQAGPARSKFYKTLRIKRLLQEERNSWRLIRTLYQDRLESEASNEDCIMENLGEHLSDKQLIENLYKRDSTVRQYQLVVDWLEKNAEDEQEMYFDRMEYFSDSSVAWENTLHILQNHSKGIDMSWNNLVCEIDPDAPIRQKDASLHEADKEDEVRLVKYMFAYLRVGQLSQAQQVAEQYGHPWLAAALEGWRLFHDANYTLEKETLNPIEGNCYRDIWKNVCWRASEEVKLPLHEKAMYAALSGNLKGLLPACENWEDTLWAYFRVAVDVQIEQELRNSMQQERPFENLPTIYWDKALTAEQIFQELQASPSEVVRNGDMTYHHIIQKFIILDDVNGLIEVLYSWLQSTTRPPPHLLRFMAHVILFLRIIGRTCKEELCTAILEAYVSDLIKERKIALVATYTATLPPAQQVMWYARFLEDITEQSERQRCLQFAEEADLNVPLITKTVVENIRSADTVMSEAPGTMMSTETTEEDRHKIEAIGWLVFDPSQRAEAIKQANALMRVFVASRKIDAAREVFTKIPPNSINVIIKEQKKLTRSTELSGSDDNSIREYLCFQAYLQAHDAFNDWFGHYHHGKPEKPLPPSDESRFTERVAYEHRLRQFEGDLERWQQSLKAQTKTTTERLYNVLLFVNGGWMVDQRTDGVKDSKRQQQLSCLRQLCIPQISFLLHNILHLTGQYKECLQIANIISSEMEQLYKTFSVQELRNLFAKLRESSVSLLDENQDPLGYPLQ